MTDSDPEETFITSLPPAVDSDRSYLSTRRMTASTRAWPSFAIQDGKVRYAYDIAIS